MARQQGRMFRLNCIQASLHVILGVLLLGMNGCATRDRVENLEKRVTALEQKQQAKESESKDRQGKLEQCVTSDSDEAYWSYIRLNATPIPGKPGAYHAPQYVLNTAEQAKKDKLEECKLLYGPR